MQAKAGPVQQPDRTNKKATLRISPNPFAQIQRKFGNQAGGQIIQAKRITGLGAEIHKPNDKYEREADEIADIVIRTMENAGTIDAVTRPGLQRKCEKCEEDEEYHIQRKCEACQEQERMEQHAGATPTLSLLKGSLGQGTSLPAPFRTEMETAFGVGFQQVRIHTGPTAVRMNRSLRAHAFTHGSDIYFNEGKFDPTSTAGRHLLAHELTHVVQQGSGAALAGKRTIQKQDDADSEDSSAACEEASGSTTVTYIHDLGGHSVRVDYRVEMPAPEAVILHEEQLAMNVFHSAQPLFVIVQDPKVCGYWIRFDITDSPLVGPVIEETVTMTIWGQKAESGLTFVSDQWVFDFLQHQHIQQQKGTEEAFDEQVIFAFFEGIGEGVGGDFKGQMNTLIQTYARHAIFLPILQFKLWQGALDGIAEQGANTLFFMTQIATDPVGQFNDLKNTVLRALTAMYEQPQSTFREFGKALGEDFSQTIKSLITPENQESPGNFLYQLGKIAGPVLLNIIVSIVQPEFLVLIGSFLTMGGKLAKFVKRFIDLARITTTRWKALALDAADLSFLSKTKSIGILSDTGEIKRELGIAFKIAPREVTEGLKSRFDLEISLGEDHHTWRGSKDGTWCRFTDEKCYLIKPGEYRRGEPDLMETDPRLTKDFPESEATRRKLESGVSEYLSRGRISRRVPDPNQNGRLVTVYRRSGHPALDMELIRRGYTLDLTGYTMTVNPRFTTGSIDLDMRIGATPEYPTNRQRLLDGLPPYLDPEHMIELHHVNQNFFEVREISSVYHYVFHEDPGLHPHLGDLAYVSWRREMTWYEGRVRTLEDVYRIMARRYWRARLAELEP